jgi:hypothetical protein
MSRTQIFVIFSGIALLIFVLELVRRRRLREEYSWLWLLTALGYLLVAVWPDLARWVGELLGSPRPVSTFTFLGFFFLFLIAIQFSVQISRLTERNKDLAQQIAILDCGLRELAEARESQGDLRTAANVEIREEHDDPSQIKSSAAISYMEDTREDAQRLDH